MNGINNEVQKLKLRGDSRVKCLQIYGIYQIWYGIDTSHLGDRTSLNHLLGLNVANRRGISFECMTAGSIPMDPTR